MARRSSTKQAETATIDESPEAMYNGEYTEPIQDDTELATEETPEVEAETVPETVSGDDFDFSTVKAEVVTVPVKEADKPNPLLGIFQESYDAWQRGENAGRKITVPESAAGEARGYLRKAAEKLECGLTSRIKSSPTVGMKEVHYAAKEKTERRYTTEDVRTWASGAGYGDGDLYPRVNAHVAKAYREAHGLPDKQAK